MLTAILAIGCGLAGAYIAQRYLNDSRDAEAKQVTRAPVADGSTADAAASPAPVSDGRILAEKIDGLSDRVGLIKKRLDELDKNQPPADVESLRVRIADLSDTTDKLAPLPGEMEHLWNRISELSATLQAVRNDLTALRSRAGVPSALSSAPSLPPESRADRPAPRAPSTSPRPRSDDHPDQRGAPTPRARDDHNEQALARGARLFREGQYQDALKVFNTLGLRDPDDARIWYYAALANGFTTRDWTGSAVRLVEKGLDYEKDGVPRKPEIDAEFKDLTTATGKEWLAAYRKRITPRDKTETAYTSHRR